MKRCKKKDAKFDKEEEEDAEKNESAIMSFSTFVNEAYDKVVFGGNKGDKSKTKEDEEDFEDDDKTDEKYDDVVLGGNKGDKSKLMMVKILKMKMTRKKNPQMKSMMM